MLHGRLRYKLYETYIKHFVKN